MKFKKEFLVFAFLLSLVCLFFYPIFLKGWLPFPGDLLVAYYAPWNFGIPHKAQGIDVVRQLFPWKNLVISQFKLGQIPFWNPYNFSGTPLLANFQSGVFYPLNSIFFILNSNLAWSLFILLQPLLACWFTYLYLRELKISRLAAILAGVAFAFSLYMTVWLEWGNVGHSLLWLPAVLFLVEKLAKKFTFKHFLYLVLCLVFSILAGYAQATIYLLIVFLAYSYFRRVKKLWLALPLALGLTAFQTLPTLELFLNSARQVYLPKQIAELLLPPFYLITTFVSDFFGNPASRNYWWPGTYIERVSYLGVLPLFFAFLGMIFCHRNHWVRFWLLVAGLSLFFSFNFSPVRFLYGLKIPLISTVVYTRLLGIFSFAGAILAGFGLDYVLKTKQTKKILKASFFFSFLYGIFWLFTLLGPKIWPSVWWTNHLPVTRRNLILPTSFAIAGVGFLALTWRWPKKKNFFLLGMLAVTVFDLCFYFQKITPFAPKEFVYPQTEVIEVLKEKAGLARFWGYGSGAIDNNFATSLKIFSTDGYDPLFIRRYGELISASENGRIKEPILRSDVTLTPGFGKEALRQNPYRQRLLDLLGVKYVLDKDGDPQTFPSEIYQPVWQNPPAGGWVIYENKQALPRAFLVGDYEIIADRQKIVDRLMAPEFELNKNIILEQPLAENLALGDQSKSQAEIIVYQPNQVGIKTRSTNAGLLFLSDNFYPGWQATVDGKPSKIYRADYSYRAVPIPAGNHRIVFSYYPVWFFRGLILTLVSLTVIIVWLWRKKSVFKLG